MRNSTLINLLMVSAILFTQNACAQNNRVTNKKYPVTAFSAIESSSIGNIEFTQSSSHNVSAEGSQELIDKLTIRVEGDKLVIRSKKDNSKFKNRNSNKLTIYVSAPQIDRIHSEGVGNITLKGTVKIPELRISQQGVGNLRAGNLNCERGIIFSEGVGNIRLAGKTQSVEIESQGVGNVDTSELTANRAVIASEGVGNVKVYASEAMDVDADGIGNVTYYGNPKEKTQRKSGIGRIKSGD